MAKDLKRKTVDGIFWTALQRYSKMVIVFVSGIILARLLTPFDYGCIGMLAIFMSVSETFIEGGFGSALIQKKRPTQEDYSTIFYWNIFVAAVLYIILFISAPAIARFYEIPLLSKVLRVQGLLLFLYAFNLVQRNQLRKSLNFKLLAIVSLGSSLIALAVTIWMAYRGYGVWALVAQNLIVVGIQSLVFWFHVKWRPSRVFSRQSFKELFGFGFFMFMTNIINAFCYRFQGLLIGKFFNPTTLGYYSKAESVETMASSSVSGIIEQVSYPVYAEMQDDLSAMQNMIKRMTLSIAYITFPMLLLLILCARPIFILLYSERWSASVPYFQVLCLAGMALCLHSVQLQSIAAIGKSRTMFHAMLVKRGVGFLAIVAGLYFFGMKGLLVGVIINNWFSYFYNAGLVSRYIGYTFRQQMLDLLPIVLMAGLSAALAYGAGLFLHLGMYADGLLKVLIFATVYVGCSYVFRFEAFRYFRSIVLPYLKKLRNGKQSR